MELSKEKMLEIAERKEKCIKCDMENCVNCDNFICVNKSWDEEIAFYEKVKELLQEEKEPERKGEWLNYSGFDDWYCSKCGFEINYDGDYPAEYDNFKYCGRCGAKMEGSIYGGREK